MEYNLRTKYEIIREKILLFLLSIWLMIPILKEMKLTSSFAFEYEYIYILIVGSIGLFFLILDLYNKSRKLDEEKEKLYNKELLPISILVVFLVWTFVSTAFSPNINNALYGTSYRKEGYITYLAYAGFFGCSFLLKSKQNRKRLINMFIGIAILNIIIVEIANKGILTAFFAIRRIEITSFFHFNHYAYYLLLVTISSNIMFLMEKNRFIKILYLCSYSFLLYYLILNNTFGCYLALGITLILVIVYSVIQKKKRFISIISVVIFIIMSFVNQEVSTMTQKNMNKLFRDVKNIITAIHIKYTEPEVEIHKGVEEKKNTKIDKNKEDVIKKSNSNNKIKSTKIEEDKKVLELAEKAGTYRMRLWINGIKFFLERPILGYGPDNLGVKYMEVDVGAQDRPHNLLIQLATTSGIIGLVTYISGVGMILTRGLKRMKYGTEVQVVLCFAVIAYLISAMFGNSMYYTSPYFFIFLGMLMCENMKKIEENKNI